MAYYSGLCTSYQDLADILVEKCQAHGWVWQDGILSKGDLFIKIEIHTESGISLLGGTGVQGTILQNDSISRVRLGGLGWASEQALQIKFPANFHCFVFANEVYLIVKSEIDKFYYLAFGKSSLIQGKKGNGLWLSATACYYRNYRAIAIATNSGGGGGVENPSPVAPFFNRNEWDNNWSNSVICHGLDGVLWSSGYKRAWCAFDPLIDRMPTNHFSDSPLLPYNIYLERPENKLSLICQFENARFLRIDNHEPEQILTLGHERWIVFPFFQKNAQNRNGGWDIRHSGTFGWAIRYEG